MYSRSNMVSQLGIPYNFAVAGNIEMLRLEIKCTIYMFCTVAQLLPCCATGQLDAQWDVPLRNRLGHSETLCV